MASPPVNISVTQVSGSTPTLNITWNPPQTNAALVTSYLLHYTSGDDTRSLLTYSNTSDSVLISNLIADGRAYEIVVEAKSIHLSGFSEPLKYQPCKFHSRIPEAAKPQWHGGIDRVIAFNTPFFH